MRLVHCYPTSPVRADRGLTEFKEWYSYYGAGGFDFFNNKSLGELIPILQKYRPYQTSFLNQWEEIGAHPGGIEYWEKEYEFVQKRLQAFDLMIEGFDKSDQYKFNTGIDLYGTSSQVGIDGEAEMVILAGKCQP